MSTQCPRQNQKKKNIFILKHFVLLGICFTFRNNLFRRSQSIIHAGHMNMPINNRIQWVVLCKYKQKPHINITPFIVIAITKLTTVVKHGFHSHSVIQLLILLQTMYARKGRGWSRSRVTACLLLDPFSCEYRNRGHVRK